MVESSKNAMMLAVVVAGALAFVWLTFEIACMPLLARAADAVAKSDPDDDDDAGANQAVH